MAKERRDARWLYKTVKKSHIGQGLKKLPRKLRKGFRTQLEGLQIPSEGRSREEYGTAFAALMERELGYLEDHEDIMDEFAEVGRLASFCGKSSRPAAYMRFLAMCERDGELDEFIDGMGFFADGRKVRFEPVPEERREEAKHIIALAEEGSDASIRALAAIVRQRLSRDEYYQCLGKEEALAFDAYLAVARILDQPKRVMGIFRADYPDSRYGWQCETAGIMGRFVANKALNSTPGLFYGRKRLLPIAKTFSKAGITAHLAADPKDLGGKAFANNLFQMVVSSESENQVEHELQHLFDLLIGLNVMAMRVDSEKRAYLAVLSFMCERSTLDETLWRMSIAGRYWRSPPEIRERLWRPHVEAMGQVRELLGEMGGFDAVRARAKELLNGEYRALYGLTYDEILEPFRR